MRLPSRRRVHGAVAALLALAACGGDSAPAIDAAAIDADPDPDRTAALALLGVPCIDSLDAVYAAHPPPAPWSATQRGAIAACAYERKVTVAEMQAHFTTEDVPPATISTDAYKFRVAYWTERGADEPQLTSAAFYVPATRRGAPSPLLVAGHGSVGVADRCAPSKEDPQGFLRDYRTQMYPLIGDGWVVMAPDYPGIGTPGVGTWQFALDEGHALLDGTRAARRLARAGLLSTKNAIVGHSNGGHAALAAQSYAQAYGSDGTIEAVVVWAPLWISNAAWGALVSDTGAVLLTPAFMAMTLMYLDAHLEVLGGASELAAAYLPDKAAAVRTLLEGGCWRDLTSMTTGASSIGVTTGRDAFTAEFVNEVGDCGLIGTCTTPLAMTWRARFAADRPPPDPSIPIVLWQGREDDFLTPGYQQCGIDRLTAGGADLTACVETGDHSSVISISAGWVRDYLASKLLGAAPPAACEPFASITPTPGCAVPIPNGTMPTDP